MKKRTEKKAINVLSLVEKIDYPISDTDMSTVCLHNNGACIISINGRDSKYFKIPDGVCTDTSYSEAKKLLLDLRYSPKNKCNTQRHIKKYSNGREKVLSTAVVEYYSQNDPENAIQIFDNDGKLIPTPNWGF